MPALPSPSWQLCSVVCEQRSTGQYDGITKAGGGLFWSFNWFYYKVVVFGLTFWHDRCRTLLRKFRVLNLLGAGVCVHFLLAFGEVFFLWVALELTNDAAGHAWSSSSTRGGRACPNTAANVGLFLNSPNPKLGL